MMCKYQVDELVTYHLCNGKYISLHLDDLFWQFFYGKCFEVFAKFKKKYFICALLFSKVLFNYLVSIHILLI